LRRGLQLFAKGISPRYPAACGGELHYSVINNCSALWCGNNPFFNILNYCAPNNGIGRSKDAVNTAIHTAKDAGGAAVYVPV